MVPGAAHRVADDRALGERAAVVRARRADGGEVVAEPHEEHGLTLGVAEQLLARTKTARVDAGAEIGTAQLLFGGHWWFRGSGDPVVGGSAPRKLALS